MTRQLQIRRGASVAQGVLDGISAVALDAARRDEAGQWGMDGWIRLIHNLLDLQMRTVATALDITLAGPSWWLEVPSTEPTPSEPIDVESAPYARSLAILNSLTRVGRPDIVIPDKAITVLPATLAPGATSFQIQVADGRYAGASYIGTVRLRRADGGSWKSVNVTFNVGL